MSKLTKNVTNRDHTLGPEDAPITLVEYGDFQCPYCGAAHPVLKQLRQRLGDRLRFVYRHFPLTEIHPYAEMAAEAAESAGEQGKFWEMFDTIFEHQDELDQQHLPVFAEQIGLDINSFIEDIEDHRFSKRIRDDFMSGVRSGVNGTPTLFINGARYDGPVEFDELLQEIGQAEKEART